MASAAGKACWVELVHGHWAVVDRAVDSWVSLVCGCGAGFMHDWNCLYSTVVWSVEVVGHDATFISQFTPRDLAVGSL